MIHVKPQETKKDYQQTNNRLRVFFLGFILIIVFLIFVSLSDPPKWPWFFSPLWIVGISFMGIPIFWPKVIESNWFKWIYTVILACCFLTPYLDFILILPFSVLTTALGSLVSGTWQGGRDFFSYVTVPSYGFVKAFIVVYLTARLVPTHKIEAGAVLFIIGSIVSYFLIRKGFNHTISPNFWLDHGPILMTNLGGIIGLFWVYYSNEFSRKI